MLFALMGSSKAKGMEGGEELLIISETQERPAQAVPREMLRFKFIGREKGT